MTIDFTEEEQKEIDKFEKEYAERISDAWLRIDALKAEDPDLNKTEEGKEALKAYNKLMKEFSETITAFVRGAEDRHFSTLGGDTQKIFDDARNQVQNIIMNKYSHYDDLRTIESFNARDVRVLDDGKFRLDRKETKANILMELRRHNDSLPDKERKELDDYIEEALNTNPFVSKNDEGTLYGKVEKIESNKDKKKGLMIKATKKYRITTTKVNNLLFENVLTTANKNHFEPLGLDRNKKVLTYANFIMPNNAVLSTPLDDYDERVYAAIVSCLMAGNNFIPWSTLYNRGMLGLPANEESRVVTEDIKKDIIESLEKFLGQVTINNDPTGERLARDPNFKQERIRESLLFYQIRTEIVHGQKTEGIAIPNGYTPVLYRYAEMNRNEIITDRIENIHISGIRYTRENMRLANATYKRIKEIEYKHSQKPAYKRELPENQRTIRYDTMAEKAGLNFSSMAPAERSRFKTRLDKYMKSYQDSGLFHHYKHERDENRAYYAVVIYFLEEPKGLKGGK